MSTVETSHSVEPRVRTALLSVSDKTHLLELGRRLAAADVSLLASGGTARVLSEAGLSVTPVEAHTQSPEVLDGRVKTLHPKIHAGILADRRRPEHLEALQQQAWPPIDLVVCNLYPFAEAEDAAASDAECIELIDIGGPTLLRAAAKNADGGVTVVVDPSDYASVGNWVQSAGKVSLVQRQQLAAKAFRHVAAYDAAIAAWWTQRVRALEDHAAADAALPDADASVNAQLPSQLEGFIPTMPLRYGENPHQPAALYTAASEPAGAAASTALTGKALSYNNYLDLDAAYRAAWPLSEHACAIVKHTNPCGVAHAKTQPEAFRKALAGDPVAAFGGILGFNCPLEPETAEAILDAQLFVECIAAPDFAAAAQQRLATRKSLRLVRMPAGSPEPSFSAHRIGGGFLVQGTDWEPLDTRAWQCVTETPLADDWLEELSFAMHVVRTLKSNAIAVTKGRALQGAGAGQMSRIDATRQALEKAGAAARSGVLASDGFFPFDDSVRLAAEAGIVAIVQPGGSKRDNEVIGACDELGLAMVFTGRRHFRH